VSRTTSRMASAAICSGVRFMRRDSAASATRV
jgi:hypothetical protein